jgi:hypothetical protein
VSFATPSGLPSVRFAGEPFPFFETSSMGPYEPPNTIFLVWKLNEITGQGQNVLDGLTGDRRVRIGRSIWSADNAIFAFSAPGTFDNTLLEALPPGWPPPAPFNQPIVTTVVYDPLGGVLRLDGVIGDERPTGDLPITGFTIGRRFGIDQQRFVGDIAELLVYSRRLSEAEIEQVEEALMDKWMASPLRVELVSPAPGAVFTAPARVTLVAEAEALDPAGQIVQVEFFAGNVSLGTVTERPFELRVEGMPIGSHTITARATDGLDNTIISSPLTLLVQPNPAELGSYADEVLRDNPVAYWRFEETSGTVAADESEDHDAFLMNDPDLSAEGMVGSAIGMIGANQSYVEAPHDPALAITESLTIEFWVNIGDGWTTDWETLVSKGDDTYQIRRSGGSANLRFDLRGGTGGGAFVDSAFSMPPNEWVHVAAVYDAGAAQMRLYINGALDNTAARSGTIGVNDWGLQIGANTSTDGVVRRFLDGTIDEVALYDHALSPARILSHYFAGLDLSPTDPALLQIEVSGGLIVLDWTDTALRLQSAEDITGPWTVFPEALPPFTVSPVESKQFYRLSNE